MGGSVLKLEDVDTESPVSSVVKPQSAIDAHLDEEAESVQDFASGRAIGVLSPIIESMVLNPIGVSLLRTNVSAFNQLREEHPEWTPDFSGENFEEAKLEGVDLSGAILCRARFISANLRGASLQGANLSQVQISTADLTHSNLRNTDFSNADLCDSDLRGADISGAKMGTADVDSGYLATITGKDGQPVKVLDLLGIKYDSETILPELSNPGVETSTIYIAGKQTEKSDLLLKQT